MSVVAGCSLFDGILLAADCRVTVTQAGCEDVYADNVQKIFPIASHTAIGFVGDLDIASSMLQDLFKKYEKRKCNDPVSLINWMTRFFKKAFSLYTSQKGKRKVKFMVASVLRGRNNVVERQKVVNLANNIFFGNGPIKHSSISNIVIDILRTPPEYTYVEIPNTSRGVLYVMRFPNFDMEQCGPLEFAAIGSGELVYEEMHKYQDSIFAMEPGNSFIESQSLRETMRGFIEKNHIPTVGGMYPALKISGKGIEHLNQGVTIQGQTMPAGGTRIELFFRDGRWFQKNVTTGKEIMLLYPWEVNATKIKKNYTFDDLSIAFCSFSGNKGK